MRLLTRILFGLGGFLLAAAAVYWLMSYQGAGRDPAGPALMGVAAIGFGIRDGIFGSLFYVMTGLHMAHVFGGVVFLVLVLLQGIGGQLSDASHDSLEAGAIYWHFVDVVWICLFTTFYVVGLS